MNKIIYLIILVVLLNGCVIKQKIHLDDKYYKKSEIIKIKQEELKELEVNEESFLIVVNTPFCTASDSFNETVLEFSNNNQLVIYEISYTNIKETNLQKSVKYCPTIVLYDKGKVSFLLDASKEADYICYESATGLKECLVKHLAFR